MMQNACRPVERVRADVRQTSATAPTSQACIRSGSQYADSLSFVEILFIRFVSSLGGIFSVRQKKEIGRYIRKPDRQES